MKNTKNKFDAVDYVNQMNHLYSNGPRSKNQRTIEQLENLKLWSQNPEAYYKKLKAEAPNGQDPKYIDPKEMEDIKKSLPVSEMVIKPEKKTVKVAGIKDSSIYKLLKNPKVIGVDLGHDTILEIMNLIQNSGLVKKPEPTIPIEEKIRRFAQAKQNDTDQIGVASLLAIPKRFSR